MEEYPKYRFGAFLAQRYAWMQERHPKLFERVRTAVKRAESGGATVLRLHEFAGTRIEA